MFHFVHPERLTARDPHIYRRMTLFLMSAGDRDDCGWDAFHGDDGMSRRITSRRGCCLLRKRLSSAGRRNWTYLYVRLSKSKMFCEKTERYNGCEWNRWTFGAYRMPIICLRCKIGGCWAFTTKISVGDAKQTSYHTNRSVVSNLYMTSSLRFPDSLSLS